MEFRRVLFRSASREAFVILSNMGNTSALPSPRRAGAVSGRPRRRGPWSAIQPAQPPERGELPEPLERREPVEPAMRARGVVELVEPTMALLEFGEAPTPSNAVELLAINPVTSLDLPVQVRAPRPDAAMVNRRRLAGEGERVPPDRPIRRGLRGTRVLVGKGTVVVGLHLPDAGREALA